jgi:hypothetical protein
VARRLVAIDMLEGPCADEWALGSALHDMVHALHPDFDGALHRSVPDRLLDLADQVVERVPAATSLAGAVSRHTFFARAFEIERTDTVVSWWTGSRRFLGRVPPPRLLAWPELRRVHTDTTTVPFAELTNALHARRRERFRQGLAHLLEKLPLTDLATCSRASPIFEWSGSSLGLFATPHGRVLGLRALALGPAGEVDAALGRATYAHVKAQAWDNVARIGDVLAERAITAASTDLPSGRERDIGEDAHYARALGASVALSRIDASLYRRLTAKLMPLAQSGRAGELPAVVFQLPPGTGPQHAQLASLRLPR